MFELAHALLFQSHGDLISTMIFSIECSITVLILRFSLGKQAVRAGQTGPRFTVIKQVMPFEKKKFRISVGLRIPKQYTR